MATAWAGTAGATVSLASPQLPPEPEPPDCDAVVSHYVGFDVLALFPNGIDFSDPRYYCFRNVVTQPDSLSGDELQFFDAILEVTVDDGSGPRVVELSGPVATVAYGKFAATTGRLAASTST